MNALPSVAHPVLLPEAAEPLDAPLVLTVDPVDQLFREWLERAAALREAEADYWAKRDVMPWWAKPGPTRLLHDGSLSGSISCVPAIVDLRPPDHPGVFRLLRPSEYDFEKDLDVRSTVHGEDSAEKWHAARLARHRELLLAQKAEEDRFGVTAARRLKDRAANRLWKTEGQIRKTAPSAARLAARILIRVGRERVDGNLSFNGLARESSDLSRDRDALVDLLPMVSGAMATEIARLLRPRAGPFRLSPVWFDKDPAFARPKKKTGSAP